MSDHSQKMYGWFSKKQILFTGINEYLTPNGEIVHVTHVSVSDKNSVCGYDDVVCVGEVVKWVRILQDPVNTNQ